MGFKIPYIPRTKFFSLPRRATAFSWLVTQHSVMRSTTAAQQIVAGKELTYQQGKTFEDLNAQNVHVISHRIHVWYIYLHLFDFYGKCR